jgi:hypothetical protein
MPVVGILLLLHNFPPSYPHCLWITRFLLTSITSFDVSTVVMDKFPTRSTSNIFLKSYPHKVWKSYPHFPQRSHTCHLSTQNVDKFSTLSTYSLLFERLSTNIVDKFSTFSTILPK